MATRADVRRIALALRGAREGRVLLEEGWRCQAPKEMLQAGATRKPVQGAKAKRTEAKGAGAKGAARRP